MKTKISVMILCFLMAAPAFGETSVWVVKTDSTTMYIGGTIHILREADKPFPPEFDRAYEASETIVLETDFEKLAAPEFQQAIMANAVYADGRTIDSVLSDTAYGLLEKYCTANGLPLVQMNQYKPSLIILTLVGMELQKMGVNQQGVDATYYTKATADKKTTVGLETVEEQLEMITTMGEGNESAFVIYSIDDLENIEENFDKIINAWKTGDVAVMEEMLVGEFEKRFPNLYKSLLVDRNNDWMAELEEYLKSPGTEFVLVGTFHLIGEDGVIAQLRDLGYEVEKMK